MNIQERILLHSDGSLLMKDGSDVNEYLKEAYVKFSNHLKTDNAIPISIINTKELEVLYNESMLYRAWGG